jgi:ribosomal protein S12 methylthiotransferase accessory factor YcaO
MREAIAALESALRELAQAKETLPSELADEVERLAEKTRFLIESLSRSPPSD